MAPRSPYSFSRFDRLVEDDPQALAPLTPVHPAETQIQQLDPALAVPAPAHTGSLIRPGGTLGHAHQDDAVRPPVAPVSPPKIATTEPVATVTTSGPKPSFNPTQATQVGDFGGGTLTQNTPTFRNTAPPPPPPAAPAGPKPAIIPNAADQIGDFRGPAPTDRISGTEQEFRMPTGQSVTDFVNFDRVLAANLEGAKRQLGRVAGRVDAKAGGARGALQAALARFDDLINKGRKQYRSQPSPAPVAAITTPRPEVGAVAGGAAVSPYGPAPGSATATAGDGTTTTSSAMKGEAGDLDDTATATRGRAQGGPSVAQATHQAAVDTKTTPTEIERLAGDAQTPRQELGRPDLPATPGVGGRSDPNTNAWSDADLERMAREGYSGPNSLVDDPAFEDLAKQIAGAQRDLDASKSAGGLGALFESMVHDEEPTRSYTKGQSKFDAALTGAAEGGEHRLRGLRDRYGNFDRLLGDSIRTTKTIGEQARREAQDTAARYQRDLDARRPKAAQAPTQTAGRTYDHGKSFDQYMGTGDISNAGRGAENLAHDLLRFTDPTYWLNQAGVKVGHAQGQGSVDPSVSGVTGTRRSALFEPDEADVFYAFSPEELAELEGLPPDEQRKRIDAKKKEIRG